jgi:hypothetical protein
MQIYEIAIKNVFAGVDLSDYGVNTSVGDHYWRVRYIEDGEEADATELFASLSEMVEEARAAGEPVAWRYYETGVER